VGGPHESEGLARELSTHASLPFLQRREIARW
jgi:hypothetical protein